MNSLRHAAARVAQYLDDFSQMLPVMVSRLHDSLHEFWHHASTAAVQPPDCLPSMPSRAKSRQTDLRHLCRHHTRVTIAPLPSDRLLKPYGVETCPGDKHWDRHRSQVMLVLPPDAHIQKPDEGEPNCQTPES